MTHFDVEQLMQAYDDEQSRPSEWIHTLPTFLTRADIEEDFNVNQDYIVAALTYQPYA